MSRRQSEKREAVIGSGADPEEARLGLVSGITGLATLARRSGIRWSSRVIRQRRTLNAVESWFRMIGALTR